MNAFLALFISRLDFFLCKHFLGCLKVFIMNFLFQESTKENQTRSELSFVPTTDDDGKTITCRAENPVVIGLFLEAHWKISVICKYLTNYCISP